jgi:hypothetical protein
MTSAAGCFEGKPASAGAAEGRAAARLDTNANNSQKAHERRANRYELLAGLRRITLLSRTQKCHKVLRTPTLTILHSDEHGAGFGGLCTCGSIWCCPVDSAKILAQRQADVEAAISAHTERGGKVAFLTLTMRHRKGQPLAPLWDALSYAWGSVTKGEGWAAERREHGVDGWLRVVEVTEGKNGWHVHIHALLFLAPDSAANEPLLALWRPKIVARWTHALERRGLSPALDRAQDFRMADNANPLAGYFTKQAGATASRSLALEFTQGGSKTSRDASGGRSPWHILAAALSGDPDELRLWHEWERASRRRRQMTWSQGLRDSLGLGREESDEEVAAREDGSDKNPLCQVIVTLAAFYWISRRCCVAVKCAA